MLGRYLPTLEPKRRFPTTVAILSLAIAAAACSPDDGSGPGADAATEAEAPCQSSPGTCKDAGRSDGGSAQDTGAGESDRASPGDAGNATDVSEDSADVGVGVPPDAGFDGSPNGGDAGAPVTGPACGGCFATENPDGGICLPPGALCWKTVAHGTLKFQNGACVAECFSGWADYDGDPSNGCEQDITDPGHCGSCATACAPGDKCAATGCVTTCPQGTVDCSTACADLSTSPGHCGSCGAQPCPSSPGYVTTCTAGQCGTTFVCPTGASVCAGFCGDPQSCPICSFLDVDPAHCGSCSNPCVIPEGGTVSCASGTCVPHCPQGTTYCGGKCVDTSRNGDNCGMCGNPCSSGGCVAGHCDATWSALVANAATPVDLLVDATYVYFIESTDLTVNRVNKGGGTVTPLGTGQANPVRLAQDDTYVYWSNALDWSVKRANKAGGSAPEPVAPSGAGGTIAVADSYVYWGPHQHVRRLWVVPLSNTERWQRDCRPRGDRRPQPFGGSCRLAHRRLPRLLERSRGQCWHQRRSDRQDDLEREPTCHREGGDGDGRERHLLGHRIEQRRYWASCPTASTTAR
jgi:hypothetical protein